METATTTLSPKQIAGHLAVGVYFGLILVKSEVISWFRIQEMFRFDSFHMYGIIGSAILVAAACLAVIRYLNKKSGDSDNVDIPPKTWEGRGTRYIAGGLMFGFGWALLGACPGPIYALIGTGASVMIVSLLAALGGAFAYGALQKHLPH